MSKKTRNIKITKTKIPLIIKGFESLLKQYTTKDSEIEKMSQALLNELESIVNPSEETQPEADIPDLMKELVDPRNITTTGSGEKDKQFHIRQMSESARAD
tara:strand:- start:57 stop:359 length:303 start_codon:yes stop_codon:yes gene_type:complete